MGGISGSCSIHSKEEEIFVKWHPAVYNRLNILILFMHSLISLKKSLVVISLLVFSFSATSVFAFDDVKNDSEYFTAISYLEAKGIVHGNADDGGFHPGINMNRAEFVKVLVGANYEQSEFSKYSNEKCFSDVKPGEWYTEYACFAKAKGIIDGYEDGSFRAGISINFAEASKVIVNAFGVEYFSSEVWYETYVEALESMNAVPVAITTLDSPVSREVMAELVYRLHANVSSKASTQMFCTKPGEGLGGVVPGNNAYCCAGSKPYIEDENEIGTRGVCKLIE